MNTKKAKKNISNISVWPFQIDNVENWAYWDNVFSADECKKIIDLGNKKELIEGTIIEGTIKGKNKNIRNSKISWIFPSNDSEWIFRRITDVILELNSKFFKFDLYGFIEGFQFTHYKEPDGKYKKHVDKYFNDKIRKLSLTIQLSNPSSYKGGDFYLCTQEKAVALPKEQGKLILFPSYILHEVKPVTKGERYSLVAWITGPQFK
jgi:PKHD-type hydroxylase